MTDLHPRLLAEGEHGWAPGAQSEPECEPASGPKREPDRQARAMAPLTRILRVIGAVALLASASTFLIQRWEEGGDLQRYFTLLAHPAFVAGLGVFCGTRLRDTKTARTFLAIAAAFVPVLSCILGGLLLSRFAPSVVPQLPSYATWVASSHSAALLALAATVAVAVPVVGFAFLTLTRSGAWPMALTYLLGNAALLIPTRDPELVTAIAGTYFLGLVAFEWRTFSRDADLRTLEGGFVRTMMLAPGLVGNQ